MSLCDSVWLPVVVCVNVYMTQCVAVYVTVCVCVRIWHCGRDYITVILVVFFS